MTVSKTTDYWTSRLDGNNPNEPVGMNNEQFAGGNIGQADGLNWRIGNGGAVGYYTLTPTTDEYTLWISFSYPDASNIPNPGVTLASLNNGTDEVILKSNGDATSLRLIGAGGLTTMIEGLDLTMSEDDAIPTVIRLTLSSSGIAKAYVYDIIEDDDGNDLTKTINAYNTNTGNKSIVWGNGGGDVKWYAIYATTMGAFTPDEMVTSNYSNVTLIQTAFGIIDVLKTARSYNLKNVVKPSGILYGYDLSSNMAVRQTPAVHVLIRRVDSPDMYSLAGTSAEYFFQVEVYVVTKGTDYRNAYRKGMAIIGECLDELYSKTGLKGSSDSLIGHDARLDTRLDPDDQICVHVLNLRYMRRVDLSKRASTS
jgi:hypothetical protein